MGDLKIRCGSGWGMFTEENLFSLLRRADRKTDYSISYYEVLIKGCTVETHKKMFVLRPWPEDERGMFRLSGDIQTGLWEHTMWRNMNIVQNS